VRRRWFYVVGGFVVLLGALLGALLPRGPVVEAVDMPLCMYDTKYVAPTAGVGGVSIQSVDFSDGLRITFRGRADFWVSAEEILSYSRDVNAVEKWLDTRVRDYFKSSDGGLLCYTDVHVYSLDPLRLNFRQQSLAVGKIEGRWW